MKKGWLAAFSALAFAVMTGCGATDSVAPSGGEMDTAPAGARSAAVTGGTIEFEDRFSDTGRFLVARSASGELSMAVQDAIGKHPGLVEATAGLRTVKGIYSVLHPNQPLPEALARLSDELDAAMASAQQPAESPTQDTLGSDADGLIFKNQSTFNATVCKNLPIDSSSQWKKITCSWNDAYLVDAYCYVSLDLSYAWNEMSQSSTHSLNSCQVVSYTLAPYTYQWAWWNTTCYCGGARVMGVPYTGSCGVTIHRYDPIIR
jgi:hypothetical protein